MSVGKKIDYKVITVTAGIIVAIVILFTLWIEAPQSQVSEPRLNPVVAEATVAGAVVNTTSRLIKNTVSIFSKRYSESH